MPKTKEERKAYNKAYHEKNKERLDAYQKARYQKNKESILARQKVYNEKDKERIATYQKAYNQTPNGKKIHRIRNWKRQGIIYDDWDSLYEKFINTKFCENCNVELTIDRYNTTSTKNLDHDHSITDKPNVRNVLCHSCNLKRG